MGSSVIIYGQVALFQIFLAGSLAIQAFQRSRGTWLRLRYLSAKEDRRIQRTRQLLSAALLKLSEERGYDLLTVNDITEQANVGRATFYLHYQDKEQLLVASLEEMFSQLEDLNRSAL